MLFVLATSVPLSFATQITFFDMFLFTIWLFVLRGSIRMRLWEFDVFVLCTLVLSSTFSSLLFLSIDLADFFSFLFMSLTILTWLTISLYFRLVHRLLSAVFGVLPFCACNYFNYFYNCLCYYKCFAFKNYYEFVLFTFAGISLLMLSAYSLILLLLCASTHILSSSLILWSLLTLS